MGLVHRSTVQAPWGPGTEWSESRTSSWTRRLEIVLSTWKLADTCWMKWKWKSKTRAPLPTTTAWGRPHSPSSESLSESWEISSFFLSRACSRAACNFLGNNVSSSYICRRREPHSEHLLCAGAVWRAWIYKLDYINIISFHLPNNPDNFTNLIFLKIFFLMWTVFKVFIEFVTILCAS